ncbi:uncharacterized protein [Palaemon carinicauda]|uniref:uncharacterized protein n=1 Tax=Palaemon carinicauda TaxID=392227 RepID=UPI0035B58449
MVKLLFFPFALILAFASAQADDKFYISDANNTDNFKVANPSTSILASWTRDINNKIILEGFVFLQYNPQRLFEYIYNPSESNAWNIIEMYRSSEDVEINPGNRRYTVYGRYDLGIRITSTKKTYWRFCAITNKCVLPALVPPATEFPVGSTTTQSSIVSSTTQSSIVSSTVPPRCTREIALENPTIVLLSICCVLVAIVIGMAVYIIRGRRAPLNEPGSNMNSEAIYEEVELPGNVSRAQQNHVIENVIYGAVIPRQA